MSSTNKTTCAMAAFAVAALMAGPAIAGTPMNVAQKMAAAEAMAQRQQPQAPQTTAQAEDAATVSNGALVIPLPEDLHSYLTASPDANGHMHVRDTDSSGSPVATTTEISNEK